MTAQLGEILILDGEQIDMGFCPPLPDHPRVKKLSDRELAVLEQSSQRAATGSERRITRLGLILHSTACWRRYLGTWELRDGHLYLVALEGRYALTGDGPLAADWFTGVLRVQQGEMLHYVHMGFGSVFERELHIRIERGRETGRRVIDNRGKSFDSDRLALDNLPGGENRFAGDSNF